MEEDVRFLERIKRDLLYGRDIAPPLVDLEKCRGCGLCVTECPAVVFEVTEGKSNVAHGERCIACGHCWAVCPEEAVVQEEVVTSLTPGPNPAVSPTAFELLVRERRSTRLFTDKPVSREQLLRIIDAGRYAPTGSNRQNIGYIVLSTAEQVAELRSLVEAFLDKASKAVRNKLIAPFLAMKLGRATLDILRFYSMQLQVIKGIKVEAYGPLPFGQAVIIAHAETSDVVAPLGSGAALYGCSLMAHSMGLGSCFLGFVQIGANEDKKIRAWLGVPKGHQCNGAIVIGHPNIAYRRLVARKQPEITWH